MATASIVIPAYNAEATLAQCLEACIAQTVPPHEIIVVDDGSTDDTAAIVERYDLRCIKGKHAGPAAARNAGARAATGDVIVFTDSDCVPERQWLAKLLPAFDEGAFGAGGSYACANGQHLLARLIHDEIVVRHQRMPREADFLGSFNAAYLRSVFWDVGGFDEDFVAASGEDNDLAYRIHDKNGMLVFNAEARVAHYHPTRLLPYLRTQARHGFWRMKMYAKHPARSGGDHYAGRFDLWAPPMALVAGGALVGLAILPERWAGVCAALIGVYLLMRVPITYRLLTATGRAESLLFFPLAILRDYARAGGLAAGVIWFQVFRRRTV